MVLPPKVIALAGLVVVAVGWGLTVVVGDVAPLVVAAALTTLGAVLVAWKDVDRSAARRFDALDATLRSTADTLAERIERIEDVVQLRGSMSTNGLLRGLRREYGQIEALVALYTDVRPSRSLPQTRVWSASPDLLYTLVDTVRRTRPKVVLECGSGVSTLLLAYSLRAAGTGSVIALEHDEGHAARTREMLVDHDVEVWAEVRHAPLVDVDIDGEAWQWYDLAHLPEEDLDLVFVDGPPHATGEFARFPAGPLLLPRITPGGVLFLDDVYRSKEAEIQRRWAERFPDFAVEVLPHEKGTARFTRPPLKH